MSNPSSRQPMRNVTPPGSDPQTANAYRASVPISVYRELTAELQAARAMLDSLNTQNQHLTKQNYQMRQEVEKVVRSHLHLQQILASAESVGGTEAPPIYPEFRPEPPPAATVRRPRPTTNVPETPLEVPPPPQPSYVPEPAVSSFSETMFTEQEEGRYRRPASPERASDVSGWWLVLAIFLIVATAFGTGFLIVRPLLKGGR